jgi:hypothetical protein
MLQEQGGVALVAAGSPGSEGSPGLTSPACEKRKAEEDTSSDLKKVRHFLAWDLAPQFLTTGIACVRFAVQQAFCAVFGRILDEN